MEELRMKWDRHILNYLIDRYEKSTGYRGGNGVNRRMFFRFNRKNIPDYFKEISSRYRREINEVCLKLEQTGFIRIIWVKYEEGNLIEKVALNPEKVEDIYRYLGRTSRKIIENKAVELAERYGKGATGWLGHFYGEVTGSLKEGKSPGRFLDITRTDEMENIFKTLNALYRLEEELPYRVFSTRVLGNSKAFEAIKRKVASILREFAGEEGLEEDEILAEAGLVKSPSYVYLSGDMVIKAGNNLLELGAFKPDIGISSAMVKNLKVIDMRADYVITVENLTSYHQYIKEVPGNYIAVYLGGYHNRPRRELLIKLYEYVRDSGSLIPFYHWGDIDYGGFTIFNHLRNRCGIEIRPLMMDAGTLKKYLDLSVKFGETYRRPLEKLLEQEDFELFHDVISLMLEEGVRLEQESIDLRDFCSGNMI